MVACRPSRKRLLKSSDRALQLYWERDGIEEAIAILEDRQIVKDLVTNPDSSYLDHQVWIGTHAWLLFRKPRHKHERVVMWLQLDERVRQEDVKNNWFEIEHWQKLIREWGGPGKSSKPRDKYHGLLYEKYISGMSSGQLVEEVASNALLMLEHLIYQHSKSSEMKRALENVNSWSDEDTDRWMNNFKAALDHFRMAGGGRKDDALSDWLKDAVKHVMTDGRTPISSDYPITASQIEGVFKTFKKRFSQNPQKK